MCLAPEKSWLAMPRSFKILILGGTRNARDLAIKLANTNKTNSDNFSPRLDVMTSLAGRTQEPDRTFGKTRIGGFGGIDGLVQYLLSKKVDLLVDATHPFATRISQNAAHACQLAQVERLILDRPEWKKMPADLWIDCENLEQAANQLPVDAIAFLALGHQYLDRFSHRRDVKFIVRMLDKPKSDVPLRHHELVIASPSHIAANEVELFQRHAITHLVCRNSGGTLIYAKIKAARMLKLPVLMVKRPPQPLGNNFGTIEELDAEIIRLSA